jgi:aldose 1-epimerase
MPDAGAAIIVLEDRQAATRVEISPARGFNAFRWLVPGRGGQRDLFWAEPGFPDVGLPTRSGNPVLFPFPNRIRDGRFSWESRSFVLPINDPQEKNALHGFACYQPWSEVEVRSQASADGAGATGRFRSAVEAREARAFWPGDYTLTVTYRLRGLTLEVLAEVVNEGEGDLPFGFGLHPYWRMPAADTVVYPDPAWTGALPDRWELDGNLPTGRRLPMGGKFARLVGPVHPPLSNEVYDDEFRVIGGMGSWRLHSVQEGWTVRTTASKDFGDFVLFTPPHRQAACLEPYTCITDAINLQPRGVDAGLLVLPAGGRWSGWVRWDFLE